MSLLLSFFGVDHLPDNQVKEKGLGSLSKNEGNKLLQSVFEFLQSGQPKRIGADKKQIIEHGFKENANVFSIVDWVARKASHVKLVAYEKKDDKAIRRYHSMTKLQKQLRPDKALDYHEKAYEPIDSESKISQILENPNSFQDCTEWIYENVAWNLLTGFTFVYGGEYATVGAYPNCPLSLWNVPSPLVEVIHGGYQQPISKVKINWSYKNAQEIDAINLMLRQRWSPDFDQQGSQLLGMSPFRPGRNTIRESNDRDLASMKLLQNFGIIGMLSSEDPGMGSDIMQGIIRKFEEKYGGSAHEYGKILGSNAPLRYLNFAESIGDLKIIELELPLLRKLCNLLQLPSVLFGDSDMAKYKNMREARSLAMLDAVLPEVEQLKNKLNKFLAQPFSKADGKQYYIDIETAGIPELQTDLSELGEQLKNIYGLSINQVLAMMGYDKVELPMADEPLLPRDKIPLSLYEKVMSRGNGGAGLSDEEAKSFTIDLLKDYQTL